MTNPPQVQQPKTPMTPNVDGNPGDKNGLPAATTIAKDDLPPDADDDQADIETPDGSDRSARKA